MLPSYWSAAPVLNHLKCQSVKLHFPTLSTVQRCHVVKVNQVRLKTDSQTNTAELYIIPILAVFDLCNGLMFNTAESQEALETESGKTSKSPTDEKLHK